MRTWKTGPELPVVGPPPDFKFYKKNNMLACDSQDEFSSAYNLCHTMRWKNYSKVTE